MLGLNPEEKETQRMRVQRGTHKRECRQELIFQQLEQNKENGVEPK
jgi:hypothetical protein